LRSVTKKGTSAKLIAHTQDARTTGFLQLLKDPRTYTSLLLTMKVSFLREITMEMVTLNSLNSTTLGKLEGLKPLNLGNPLTVSLLKRPQPL
jgi:hypothetical protein